MESLRQKEILRLPGTWTNEDYSEFVELIVEMVEREGDSLNIYDPLPVAKAFHECLAHEQGLSGSNQAGKTNAASTEVAWAATGEHPIEGKYPRDNVRIACIGNDGRHLSLMYEYLFEKAPYKRFLHPETQEWIVVVADDPEHRKYEDLWDDAPPVIPPRLVKKVTWISKGEKEPKSVRLHNGTVIRFYSGLVRKMPQGRKFHLVWIDEEIENAKKWLDELRARIQSLNGRIIWSATPQLATEQFLDLELKSLKPENSTLPLSQQTAFFVMLSKDNKYISREGREAFVHKLQDDDEQMLTRYFGKSARSILMVYNEFTDDNIIPPIQLRWHDTRHIIIDPGVDTCAVWFLICPQLDDPRTATEPWRINPGCYVVYDELLIKRASSQIVADEIARKLGLHPVGPLRDITIDQRGARSIRSNETGPGQTLEILYWEKIKSVGIRPLTPHWEYGNSEVKVGIDMTKSYLRPQVDTPWIRLFVTKNCKDTIYQFRSQKKKRNPKGDFIGYEEGYDLLDCARYATTRELIWVPPPESAKLTTLTRSDYRQIMRDLKSGKGLL